MTSDRLKIAMLVGEFPARSTTFIVNQIVGLLDRGHEVDIIASRRGDEDALDANLRDYALLERTTFTELPTSRIVRVAKAGLGVLSNAPKGGRGFARALNGRRYGPLAASGALLFGAFSLAPPRRYDILHSHFAPNGLRALFYRDAGILEGKIVTSFHGYDVNVFPRRYGKDVYRSLFADGDLFMANTDFILEGAAALGCPRDRLVRHPMGVDLSRYAFRARAEAKKDAIRIVSTGRLVEVKGFEFLLRAFQLVHADHPNTQLEILGDGPLRVPLESLARELGLADAVEFAGGVDQGEVQARYARADLFAMACVRGADGAEEGQGLVFAEAQACGLPVVATQTGGIPEAVRDGKSGFLVPDRDVDALAERLGWLVAHPEAWADMGSAGRRHVEAEFDRSELNIELERTYSELMGRD